MSSTLILALGPIHFRIWMRSRIDLSFLTSPSPPLWTQSMTWKSRHPGVKSHHNKTKLRYQIRHIGNQIHISHRCCQDTVQLILVAIKWSHNSFKFSTRQNSWWHGGNWKQKPCRQIPTRFRDSCGCVLFYWTGHTHSVWAVWPVAFPLPSSHNCSCFPWQYCQPQRLAKISKNDVKESDIFPPHTTHC